jgi:uncharacterized RDD family membrane protein YckC
MVETKSFPRAGLRAQTQQVHIERNRAPFSLRCGALLIDYIIVATIVALTTLIARLFGGGARMAGDTVETVGWVAAISVTVLNFVFLAGLRGQTLGKMATGLRVVRLDGRPLSFLSSLLRYAVGYPLSMLTLGVGFLMAVPSPDGRALHDIIAGTVVVVDEAQQSPKSG